MNFDVISEKESPAGLPPHDGGSVFSTFPPFCGGGSEKISPPTLSDPGGDVPPQILDLWKVGGNFA